MALEAQQAVAIRLARPGTAAAQLHFIFHTSDKGPFVLAQLLPAPFSDETMGE